MTFPEQCWNCGKPAGSPLFCHYCNHLQPPAPDYYRFFGLERRLNLDLDDLRQRFYTLSRRLHPDRFMRATPREREFSLEATAILNDAYRTLRDPVARAEYMLREEGFESGRQNSSGAPPELLDEVFELNMLLEEWRSGETGARPQLEEAHGRLAGLRAEADAELQRLFEQYDQARDRGVLAVIRGLLNRRRYVHNLELQVEKELADVRTISD